VSIFPSLNLRHRAISCVWSGRETILMSAVSCLVALAAPYPRTRTCARKWPSNCWTTFDDSLSYSRLDISGSSETNPSLKPSSSSFCPANPNITASPPPYGSLGGPIPSVLDSSVSCTSSR
jgi:hypothetical protein